MPLLATSEDGSKRYNAPAKTADLIPDGKDAIDDANDCIENKIQCFIPIHFDGPLLRDTAHLVINTLYFQAR